MLPFSSTWLGKSNELLSLGFSLVPVYGAISCRFGVLYLSLFSLRHLGINSRIANSNIRNDRTAATDIPTILFVLMGFPGDGVFDPSADADGPSACLLGLLPGFGGGGGGGELPGFPPGKNGVVGVGGGVPDDDVGGDNGAALELIGLPSLLHVNECNGS